MTQKNYEGSSPNMETEAAHRLWSRSITLHKLRYKWMINDGDSKVHQRINKIYGESDSDIVENLDCIGHVGKRIHHALTGVNHSKRKVGI